MKKQKQHLIDMMKDDEDLGLYDEIQPKQIWNEEKMEGIKKLIQDHKQETLEEAAKDFANNFTDDENKFAIEDFIAGAKWQQDKICNSEVLQKIRASKSDAEARRIIKTI